MGGGRGMTQSAGGAHSIRAGAVIVSGTKGYGAPLTPLVSRAIDFPGHDVSGGDMNGKCRRTDGKLRME